MNHKDYQTSINVNVTAKEAQQGINSISKWWTKSFKGKHKDPVIPFR